MCNKYLLIKLKSKYHVPVEARLVCDNIPLTQLIWHKQIIFWWQCAGPLWSSPHS